jgi:acetylornithine/succinyldiaminopimelate/putrescine aminotransferase
LAVSQSAQSSCFARGTDKRSQKSAPQSSSDGCIDTRTYSRQAAAGACALSRQSIFLNSGSEAVEAAIKFARAATGRPGIVYCEHAFHGLSYGALSLNGSNIFRSGFGPLLPGCIRVAFNDLVGLERALHSKTVAALIVEPIRGKAVNNTCQGLPQERCLLCLRYGTLFIADEVQTSLGRTGRFSGGRALGRRT